MKRQNTQKSMVLLLVFFFVVSFAFLSHPLVAQAKDGWVIQKNKTYYISKKTHKRVKGFHTIDKKKYYFRSDGSMAQNCTIKMKDHYYYFRQNGTYKTMPCYIKIIDSNGRVCTLHREYASDPQIGIDITEEDLLTATVYTEANVHGKVGMTAVGLVVLNRMSSGKFPADLAICVYSKIQFQIARNGALTTALKNIANHRHTSAYKTARSAAKAAMKIYKNHMKYGTPRKIPGIKMPAGKKDFDYLFFMTTGSFKKLGLDRVGCGDAVSYKPKNVRCSAHIFFKRWAYK